MKRSVAEWQFGETDRDAVLWMQAPETLHVYVDFRTADTPRGKWYRVIAVTHGWIRAHIADPSASHSWPAALVVPDGSLTEARAAIERLLSDGCDRIVAREAKLISDSERISIA